MGCQTSLLGRSAACIGAKLMCLVSKHYAKSMPLRDSNAYPAKQTRLQELPVTRNSATATCLCTCLPVKVWTEVSSLDDSSVAATSLADPSFNADECCGDPAAFLAGDASWDVVPCIGDASSLLLGLMLKHLHLLAGHCHHRQSPDSSACQQLPARHHMCQTQRGQSAPPSDLQNSHNRLARQPAEETVQHSVPHAVYDCSTPHLWFLSSAAVATGLTSIPNIMQKQAESAAALAPVLCLIRWLSRLSSKYVESSKGATANEWSYHACCLKRVAIDATADGGKSNGGSTNAICHC